MSSVTYSSSNIVGHDLNWCVLTPQVLPCNKGYRHDWTVCPYVHEKEKARRRPLTCNYTGIACPEMKKVRQI